MMETIKAAGTIPERRGVTAAQFAEEILPAATPVVLRGAVSDWPVTAAGRESPAALAAYLKGFGTHRTVRAMLGKPSIDGRFFYNDDLSDFNFRAESVQLGAALDLLLAALDDPRPASLAIQSVTTRAHLPGFDTANPMHLLAEETEPRVWIGNKVTIAAHHDPSENLACVVAGRRRFTLFPPDQVGNLYPGPFELTPAGPIISMVDFAAPDLERFPRFADAMASAMTAELEPGDAIFIPYLWWHHVESLERFNMLVNYWWTPQQADVQPVQALLHAMLLIKDLPEAHRAGWRALFDHYVFGDDGPPGTHLPADRRGIQGTLSPALKRNVRGAIARTLKD